MSPKIFGALGFVVGFLFAVAMRQNPSSVLSASASTRTFHVSSLPVVGVSHNPEIKKQVLASYLQLPHITQVSMSTANILLYATLRFF